LNIKAVEMTDNIQLTTHELWIDGRQMTITANKLNTTTLRLSWTLPTNPAVYDGFVVLLSESKFSAIDQPVDGTRYTPSTNWQAPADTIDGSQVVAAAYGFFGDDTTVTFVDVSNIQPDRLYYASIHACSNVLQYYTIGCQSYPLESARNSKGVETYAGSIPSTTAAPTNPYNGQAYFDPAVNTVFVWNAQMQGWVQSSQSTIPTGSALPIQPFQLFYNTINETLEFFNGSTWTVCSSANTRVKMGATWAPFNSITATSAYPATPSVGDFAYVTIAPALSAPATFELKFFSLGSWFFPATDLVQVYVNGTWHGITLGNLIAGQSDPAIPNIGDFFYQSSTRNLLVWAGASWERADTAEEGTPTSDKVGIGTDGTYDERLRLINVLKHQLGYPAVCNELSEEQFNVAIDNALDEFRRRADNAYSLRYVSYTLNQGQTQYYLNDPRDKTDKIVNVLKIHRINQLGISSLSAETGLYAQAFFNQLYQGSNVDVLSIHLMNQLSETYEKIFAGNLMFTWDEASREMMILRRINQANERVVLEVVMERTEQELLVDRWAKQWLQGWAQSELWEMLGEIRSKYGSVPGPNGGITLNGSDLLVRSNQQQTELLRQITDYEVGNGGVNFLNTSFYIG
jgi:hypothetical protein